MKKVWNRIRAIAFLPFEFSRINREHKVLQTQIDFLMRNNNRRIRRKWRRVLTNPRSPFYIGQSA